MRTLLPAETLRIAAARDARISIVEFARAIGGGWETDSVAAVNLTCRPVADGLP